jgi:Histidine kinase-like ATPase domain
MGRLGQGHTGAFRPVETAWSPGQPWPPGRSSRSWPTGPRLSSTTHPKAQGRCLVVLRTFLCRKRWSVGTPVPVLPNASWYKAVCAMPDQPVTATGTAISPLPEPPGLWRHSNLLTLGALKTAPACARLHVNVVLHEWNLGQLVDAAVMVTSELVTNAILASRGPRQHVFPTRLGTPVVHLRLLSDAVRLVIEVWDQVPEAPVMRQADAADESGRGLMLVEALSAQWGCGIAQGWPGKVVWAVIAASSDTDSAGRDGAAP